MSEYTAAPLTMTIPLTRGYEAIIDAADYPLVSAYKWRAMVVEGGKFVYAMAYVRGSGKRVNGKFVGAKHIYMHRLILQPASDKVADHINGKTLDNRRANLREVDSAGNARNNNMARLKALLDKHGIAY